MPLISLVIIAKNEARNIARCLDSVPFAGEKLVLDSGSQDDTVRLAQAHGARVVVEEWRGFYRQRVRATELAKYDWVLFLDGDEALSSDLAREIENLMKAGEPAAPAYALPRLSYHMGRWIRHGGWYPDRQVRLFDRRRAGWQEGEVHEKVAAEKVDRLKAPILHWVFENLTDQIETNNRYSSLGAEQLRKQGHRPGVCRMLFKAYFKFLETYIWKRGFLDGVPGLVIAVGAAYSMFLKHAKLWEMSRVDPSSNGTEEKVASTGIQIDSSRG
jgi:glycosyltransferase involved in cell wall biosynthesis